MWLLVTCSATKKSWSRFLKQKSDLPERAKKLMVKLIQQGYKLQQVKMDNAGENLKLKELCEDDPQLCKVEFKLTPPNSPQFNGICERKFATLWSRVRALLNAAGLPEWLRNGLWTECARYAEIVENQLVHAKYKQNGSAYKRFYGLEWEGFKALRQWEIPLNCGELGGVSLNTTLHNWGSASQSSFSFRFSPALSIFTFNGICERKFAILWSRVRALLSWISSCGAHFYKVYWLVVMSTC